MMKCKSQVNNNLLGIVSLVKAVLYRLPYYDSSSKLVRGGADVLCSRFLHKSLWKTYRELVRRTGN